jgi:PAT family beta-lactamase induction signal transducer AmpG
MAIGASKRVAWPILFAVQSVVYLPAALLMVFSPEPDSPPSPPRSLREAVWEPILDFLRQHRAVEIATFLVLYKFGDNLASALVSPFLLDKGYTPLDVGPLFFWLGFAGSILGALAGGAITSGVGLGHALWLFGFLQAFSNLGYILLAQTGVNRPLMCGAMFFESATTGMGTGAFSVLLLRLTQKRFSATQYALLSSIFALGRTASGPLAGVLSDALGWTVFFALTIVAAVPGLVMLQRFVPLGTREPTFGLEEREAAVAHADLGPPRSLARRALTGAAGGLVFGLLYGACLNALKGMRSSPGGRFDLGAALQRYFAPSAPGDWIGLIGVLIFAVVCGLVAVAFAAARREGRNVRA